MCSENRRLTELKKEKEVFLKTNRYNSKELNKFHDGIFNCLFQYILSEYIKTNGEPPCSFVWFVTGSAGRKEQGILSDQDHGIIYEKTEITCNQYFMKLGKWISDALDEIGYPYCEGNVMSSNSTWCKSLEEWKQQLHQWLVKENWESIRFLQIFYDSRKIFGDQEYVQELRNYIHQYCVMHPALLKRFMNNVMRIKKGVGIFGQFFVERSGSHKGSIHLKHTMYLPYVNSIRLLSIRERIQETSTIERIKSLREIKKYDEWLKAYEYSFNRILEYRIILFKEAKTYEDVHYLNIKQLSKEQRQEIKTLMRNGIKLYQQVQRIMEKGC
ncbi:DUF294 nucleotidyltransferase-like domain-containing protein [Niallia sp. Sow4_A1]|jgi:CBS domain-containing protein|uniref:DUF294 nucleotidyltransferase-like domain-containing protein n=1 Tax=Niallia hominis TaxID=3133173 RepID=A0ABV1F1R3_9BACI|nr:MULTISPECIES: DUF294 nucleotidyltransferase-like domain-containing protein [Bacillaceae]MCF2649851.1 hypothetical protein [Niallia circulans]MCM3364940.1 DUF294 nucleotidyltransferase-like domain-containing protein [Niallia sp. MER TA 168]CAI9393530.1 hypothetical protein BACSP_03571 [Bacillus sp. T2.9-1]